MKTIPLLALLALTGCFINDKDSGDTGLLDSSGPSCEDTPTAIDLDEATALGVSGQDLLDLAGAVPETELYWVDGGAVTGLSIGVSYAGEARWVISEEVPCTGPGDCPAIAVICDDRLEVDVAVTFATDDGAFDETWAATLSSTDGQTATFSAAIDPDALGGTWTPESLDPDQYDSFSVSASGRFDEGGPSGAISAQGTGTDGDVAWAENIEIARWPASDEW